MGYKHVFVLAVSLMCLGTASTHAAYLAYAVGEKSEVALPERIDKIDAKYLLNIKWGEYAGARSRVAVLEVDNNSSSNSISFSGPDGQSFSWDLNNQDQVPVNGIEAIVTDVMNQTGRFRLIERQELGSILQEQDLAASGRVAKPSGAKTGNVLGAQYLVQVVITDYEAKTSGTNSGIGGLVTSKIPLLGGFGVKSGKGQVGLNFRLIDAETSEVMYTKQVQSVIKESGLTVGGAAFSGGGALGGFFSNYSKTPIGQAVIAGINKGVYELVKEIGAAPASGSVIKTEGKKIWLNMGSDAVSVGDVLTVMSKGEELIDPDTGISLGSSDTEVGSLKVSQAQEKFSIADTVSLNGQVKRGDKVVSTAVPPSIEYASKWKKPKRGKF
jgi:curli biogenesis system outer membrane secretion channel CsgG